MDLKTLALQVLETKQSAKLGLKKPENRTKLLPKKNIQKFSSKSGTPYLTENGEFRVKNGLLNEPILDALLRVGASDAEIEKHIGPHLTVNSWKRWQEIKQKTQCDQSHRQTQNIKI